MSNLFKKLSESKQIDTAVNRIESISEETNFEKIRNSFLIVTLKAMHRRHDIFDGNCKINIEWIGSRFEENILNNDLSKHNLDKLCSMCYRFVIELDLSFKGDVLRTINNERLKLWDIIEEFDYEEQVQIKYACYEMPISIFKELAYSEEVNEIKGFSNITDRAKKLKSEWDRQIKEKQDTVNQLKESLDKYKDAFNFVGLYDGFSDLYNEKMKEKNNVLLWMRVVSILIVIPIFSELVFIYLNISNLENHKTAILFSIFPTLSLVGILVYYFRILLVNYKSVKSQLLQIDLRKTLCRFIQSYADYSTDIKEKDEGALNKFENIIFSGIVTDSESLPSTFDGIEQLGKFINSVK
ncbi:hypothetical protein [Vibrio parahaemolyticus]